MALRSRWVWQTATHHLGGKGESPFFRVRRNAATVSETRASASHPDSRTPFALKKSPKNVFLFPRNKFLFSGNIFLFSELFSNGWEGVKFSCRTEAGRRDFGNFTSRTLTTATLSENDRRKNKDLHRLPQATAPGRVRKKHHAP